MPYNEKEARDHSQAYRISYEGENYNYGTRKKQAENDQYFPSIESKENEEYSRDHNYTGHKEKQSQYHTEGGIMSQEDKDHNYDTENEQTEDDESFSKD